MQFFVEGTQRQFLPVQEFRSIHHLPTEFGVGLFEPKDYCGLGRIDEAGAKLNELHDHVLAALPAKLTIPGWIEILPAIVGNFERELMNINDAIGLRESEIGFAVSGFSDVLQNYLFTLMRMRLDGLNLIPSFTHSYGKWLSSTARVSQNVYSYGQWKVQLVTHAYGRYGMIVMTEAGEQYVYDPSLGCPVEGFMKRLLSDITVHIIAGL